MELERIDLMDADKDEFRVPHSYVSPFLDGVYLAINAVAGSYLVYDAHSCGYFKAEKIAGNHDLGSDLMRWDQMNRVVRTNLDTREYIMGSDDKLSKKILQVCRRYRPEVVAVVRSNVVITTGHDATPVLRDIAKKIDVPLVVLPDSSVERDHVSGFLVTLEGLLKRLPFSGEAVEGPRVALVGAFFHRNEGDCLGNVAELQRLAEAIGCTNAHVFPDGRSFDAHGQEPPPTAVVDMGGSWRGAKQLGARFDAPVAPLGVPLGIEGTSRWLRGLGELVGMSDRVEEVVDAELESLVPALQWVIPRHLLGTRVVVMADHLHLPGLVELVEELGMTVVAVGSTSQSFEGRSTGALEELSYPRVPELVDDLARYFEDLRGRREADLVISTSFIRQLAEAAGLPVVELGFPSATHHVLHHAPYLGYTGVRVLVERIVNALERAHLGATIRREAPARVPKGSES